MLLGRFDVEAYVRNKLLAVLLRIGYALDRSVANQLHLSRPELTARVVDFESRAVLRLTPE